MNKSSFINSMVICSFLFSACAQSESKHDWDWPYKRDSIEVLNNLSTLQFYGPFPGFHHGLDLLSNGQEKVYAPASGKVGTRYYYKRKSPYTYEIFIELDDGYRIELHHIDIDTIPPEIEALAKIGGRIEKGRYLGTIYDSRKMGIPMHLHTNLKTPDGYYANPLQRYPKIIDKTNPVIEDVFIATTSEAGYTKIDPTTRKEHSSQDIYLIVKAYDLVKKSLNRLGLYKLEISVDEEILKRVQFDQLPEKRFTKGTDIYAAKPILIDGNTIESGNMNNPTERNFFYKIRMPERFISANKSLTVEVNVFDFNANKSSKLLVLNN